jgi:hypothetical protein
VIELGFNSFEEYEKAAVNFASNGNGTIYEVGNKMYKYDSNTTELVAVGKDTNLVTYFKPKHGDKIKAQQYVDNFIKNRGGKKL